MATKFKSNKLKIILFLIILIYLLGYLKERYFIYYPTIPLYPDNYTEIK